MKLSCLRFGEIEIQDEEILTFAKGIPGLEDSKRFAIIHPEETHPIMWLQSIDEPNISLPVIDPFFLYPDYNFDISEDDLSDLEIEQESDVYVINVLVIPQDVEKMTINLIAPIIINVKRNAGKQIFIDYHKYSVRQPVYEAFMKRLKGGDDHASAD